MQMYAENKKSEIRYALPYEEALGILLKDCSLFTEYRNQFKADMFYQYAEIYKVMQELDNDNNLTFKNVAFHLRDQIEFLHSLRNTVISTQMLPDLIQQMKKIRLKEQLDFLISRTRDEDPDELYQKLRDGLDKLSITETNGLSDPETDFDKWYESFEEIINDPSKALGLMTGIDELDRITTGFHSSDLIVVGARTSIGKSAFMIEMVLRLTKAGYKCAIFSLEMTKKQIYYRMMSNLLIHPLKKFRQGDFPTQRLSEVTAQRDFLKNIFVDDSRGVSADYISDTIRQLKRTRGLDFVVVDYLQDVKETGEQNDNSGSSLARICRKLRKAAQEADLPVMALSQVTRDVERREDKRPQSSDLAGSTGIETSADVIAMLYRDDYYNADTDKQNVMEVNFVKQRNGELGKVELYYDKQNQRLVPLGLRYDR